jgi:hypothetical protein
MNMTATKTPPMIASDEATEDQLQLAREQGDMMGKALDHMITKVADDGQEKKAGDYLVGYAIEKAEGMYMMDDNGELQWHEPEEENIHVEVSVRDGADGRFIPCLTVHARLVDSEGNDAGMHKQPFIWHPWVFHYGRNWHVEKEGDYKLVVDIKAPDFHRHDKKNGKRFADDVNAVFSEVKISLEE